MSKGEKIDCNVVFLKIGQIFSCKGSVDTTINGVDTMAQRKGRNVKKRSTSVDTSPRQVDTRDRSQRNMLTGFHLRSTLNQIILVPRSATFSTCPKGDSDMMFWAIQNQSINMAQVIIEGMRFAVEMIWDKKIKLAVSLPYAHLLTRIFKHYGIDLKGEVMEKMGQPIRSKNVMKIGFSLVGNVWTKTSMEEGEAIIGEALEIPVVQHEEAVVRIEEPVAVARRIEEIAPEHIKPIGQSSEIETPSTVIASIIEETLETVAHAEREQEETLMEDTPNVPAVDVCMEGSLVEVTP
ncbi:hypothetical protein Taro_004711 [Colocasia esculenta]|uniref:Uncharacterized protein n=1 Tax=Colocasia esculenta TaxID=4460 RepID=A0A843TSF6_COLES|nr:hypothetical protein [Colocasia esculenta]